MIKVLNATETRWITDEAHKEPTYFEEVMAKITMAAALRKSKITVGGMNEETAIKLMRLGFVLKQNFWGRHKITW